eukprot:g2684.t1
MPLGAARARRARIQAAKEKKKSKKKVVTVREKKQIMVDEDVCHWVKKKGLSSLPLPFRKSFPSKVGWLYGCDAVASQLGHQRIPPPPPPVGQYPPQPSTYLHSQRIERPLNEFGSSPIHSSWLDNNDSNDSIALLFSSSSDIPPPPKYPPPPPPPQHITSNGFAPPNTQIINYSQVRKLPKEAFDLTSKLFAAAAAGSATGMQELFEKGADPLALSSNGMTVAHIALKHSDAFQCLALLSDFASVTLELSDNKGRTPLHIAASRGWKDSTSLLLQSAVSPRIIDDNGLTAVALASLSGHTDCASLLTHYDMDHVGDVKTALHATEWRKIYMNDSKIDRQPKTPEQIKRLMEVWSTFFANASVCQKESNLVQGECNNDTWNDWIEKDDEIGSYLNVITGQIARPYDMKHEGRGAEGGWMKVSSACNVEEYFFNYFTGEIKSLSLTYESENENWVDVEFEEENVERKWQHLYDENGEMYYLNISTGETTWQIPKTENTGDNFENSEWTPLWSEDHQAYYWYNNVTGESQWE